MSTRIFVVTLCYWGNRFRKPLVFNYVGCAGKRSSCVGHAPVFANLYNALCDASQADDFFWQWYAPSPRHHRKVSQVFSLSRISLSALFFVGSCVHVLFLCAARCLLCIWFASHTARLDSLYKKLCAHCRLSYAFHLRLFHWSQKPKAKKFIHECPYLCFVVFFCLRH